MTNNNLSEKIANLYNAIFNKIDIIFTEHKFKLKGESWESPTYLTGQPHQRHDKTKIYKKDNILYISEQGGETLSLIDYVKSTKGGGFNEVFNYLANFTSVEKIEAKNTLKTSIKQSKNDIYKLCHDFFKYNLLQTQSDRAKKALNYLNTRGYDLEKIKFCEFGVIENLNILRQKLELNGYKKNDIEEALNVDSRTQTSHFLTLPYIYNKKIQGFKFRVIEQDIKPKYLNTYNLPKKDNFFNFNTKNFDLKKSKNLIIVEGELDCLSLAGEGFWNVVALGGDAITSEQIEVLKNNNFEQIFLFLDIEANNKNFNNIQRNIYKILEVNQSVFIVDFVLNENEAKQDPANLLKQYGKAKIVEAFESAKYYYNYLFEKLIKTAEPTNEADKDKLLKKSMSLVNTVKNEIHKGNLINLIYKHLAKFNIVESLETFEAELKRLDKLDLTKDLDSFKYKASKTTIENLNALKQDLNDLTEATNVNSFKDFFKHTTATEIFESFRNQPKNLDTKFTLDDKTNIILPSGGLSFVAAPTGHGKTTFLINVVLNALRGENILEKNKSIYFFTFEETKENIILYMLNTLINNELNDFNKNNRDILKEYFKTNNLDLIKDNKKIKDSFNAEFKYLFSNLLETKKVNVIYTDYSVESLVNAIKYANTTNYKPGLIIIDYIQLMHSDTNKTGTRQEELKNICLQLKDLAINIKTPFLIGTQFNRAVKAPNDLHVNHLSEAGDIERIASLIISFFNNMYLEDVAQRTDTLSLKILKNRGGKNGGTATLNFNGNTGKIESKEQYIYNNFDNSDNLQF